MPGGGGGRKTTRRVFVRDGREYRAWVPATARRKMDLTDERIASREANARSFLPGWDDRLRRAGHLLRLHDEQENQDIWFVDTRAGARELGCTPRSLEKNLEIMRHLRALPPSLHHIASKYGFEVQRATDDGERSVAATPSTQWGLATSPRSVPVSRACSPMETTPLSQGATPVAPRHSPAPPPMEEDTNEEVVVEEDVPQPPPSVSPSNAVVLPQRQTDTPAPMDPVEPVPPPPRTPEVPECVPTPHLASENHVSYDTEMRRTVGAEGPDGLSPVMPGEPVEVMGIDDEEFNQDIYAKMLAPFSRLL